MDSLFHAMTDPLYLVLLFFVCFGMVCALATFGFMMPVVANVIGGVFTTIMGEQVMAKAQGKESGTVTPPILDRDFKDPAEAR